MVWFRVAKEFKEEPRYENRRQKTNRLWWTQYFQERREIRQAAKEKARIMKDVRRLLARYMEEGVMKHEDRMAMLRKEDKKLYKQYIKLKQ